MLALSEIIALTNLGQCFYYLHVTEGEKTL